MRRQLRQWGGEKQVNGHGGEQRPSRNLDELGGVMLVTGFEGKSVEVKSPNVKLGILKLNIGKIDKKLTKFEIARVLGFHKNSA